MSEFGATISPNPTGQGGNPIRKSPEPRPWGIWSTLGWFAAAHIILVGASIWGLNPWRGPGANYLQLVAYLNAAGVLWAAARFSGWPIAEYLALSWPGGRDFVRGLTYGIAGKIIILLLTIGIVETLLRLWGAVAAPPTVSKDSLAEGLTAWSLLGSLLWLWITLVLLTPLFEELLFRGLLYRGLAESRVGTTGAILITALLFGLMHYGAGDDQVVGGKLVAAISNVLLGLLLGWIRWRNESTTASILVHAGYNLYLPVLYTALLRA